VKALFGAELEVDGAARAWLFRALDGHMPRES